MFKKALFSLMAVGSIALGTQAFAGGSQGLDSVSMHDEQLQSRTQFDGEITRMSKFYTAGSGNATQGYLAVAVASNGAVKRSIISKNMKNISQLSSVRFAFDSNGTLIGKTEKYGYRLDGYNWQGLVFELENGWYWNPKTVISRFGADIAVTDYIY